MAWLQFGTLCGSAIDWWAGLWHLPWFYAIPGDHLYDYVWRTVSLLEVAGLALVCWSAVSSECQPPAAGPTSAPPPAIGGPAAQQKDNDQSGKKKSPVNGKDTSDSYCPNLGHVKQLVSEGHAEAHRLDDRDSLPSMLLLHVPKRLPKEKAEIENVSRSDYGIFRVGPAALSALITLLILAALHHHPIWPGYWLEPVFVVVAGVNLWCGFFLAAAVGPLVPLRRICRWVYLPDISGFERQAVLALWCLLTGALYSGAALSIDRIGLAGELLNCVALPAATSSSKLRGTIHPEATRASIPAR